MEKAKVFNAFFTSVFTVHPWRKVSNSILGCIRKSIASRWKAVILPLYSALVRNIIVFLQHWTRHSSLECRVQCWAPQYKKDTQLREQVQSRAKDMIKGQEHLSYVKRLGELGLFSLEKRILIRGALPEQTGVGEERARPALEHASLHLCSSPSSPKYTKQWWKSSRLINLLSQASNKAELTPAPLHKEFQDCSPILTFERCDPHRR
ncbi:hypothetical protein QYF61_018652 [Mycteria americana]|uniref:Uncharacterized protein n=1 Tax=Mycteria americana TaxID=33587 RepID=A0AAN7RQZ7_MYCAM|nr:hypothetical protein QYF61_018652 [Mycteria americana]